MTAEAMIDGGAEITEPYGCNQPYQPCPCAMNPGLDLAADCGKTIRAVGYGLVVSVGSPCWAGPHAVIVRSGDVDLLWAHCSAHYVTSGDRVVPGQALAAIGSMTGCPSCGAHQADPCAPSYNCGGVATGPHTHFQVNESGMPFDSGYCRGINPYAYLTDWPGQPPEPVYPPLPPPLPAVRHGALLLLAGAGAALLIAGRRS